ncbi:MAG: polysaccharide biosynthesis/export family protein [Thermoguttaceae bacterium]
MAPNLAVLLAIAIALAPQRSPALAAPPAWQDAGRIRIAAAEPTPAETLPSAVVTGHAPVPVPHAAPVSVTPGGPPCLCQSVPARSPVCGPYCRWECARSANWQAYAQGEYIARDRTPHVSEYRLRVGDELDMVYRMTREERPEPYRINVGDEIRVESMADPTLDRELLVQPDGMITLRLLGQVKANGLTLTQLGDAVEEAYRKYYKSPSITVTPIKLDTKLEDLRAAVDRRMGVGGQSQLAKITPEGSISLPGIGWVYVQGLTVAELQVELGERYAELIPGMEVIPVIVSWAPRYAFVLGEVAAPGRFELTGPTTILQAIAMAGSWNNGARLDQVVVFRRDDNWRLVATMVDLRAALRGKSPCPEGEIWLSDSDVVIVPKGPILETADFIELVFTRGIYGVMPFSTSYAFESLTTLP